MPLLHFVNFFNENTDQNRFFLVISFYKHRSFKKKMLIPATLYPPNIDQSYLTLRKNKSLNLNF